MLLSDLSPTPVVATPGLRRRTAGIIGLGRALPATVVENAPIAARIGVEPAWITKRTGISARRRCAGGEGLTELAIAAGARALGDAGVDPAYVDAVLVATSSADDIVPQAAPLVAGALGAHRAMTWDVGLACTGFLAGLQQGAALIESGRANTVLLIGADILGQYTDHDDRQTAALFGDGAAAAVLAPGGPACIGPVVLGADAQREMLYIDRPEGVVRMEGRLVYEKAIDHMERSCRVLLALAGLGIDDIDLVIAHQANGRIINAVRERFGLERDRVADYVADFGNTSAASIPLALSLAADDGRLPKRGHVLLTAFGAGFSWGAALLTYGGATP
ncbi:MAG: 3-oxoacyl-[acyl-carrier-protein] synthase [Solirubrobacteraceae bacterium]|nr:3-oxoacyl-[acyl-carrier-protein] synthase [Solirubrobacteraceae bacterium]